VVDDVTTPWPADRELVELGKIRLDAVAPDNSCEQQHMISDPIARVDGIEASARCRSVGTTRPRSDST
jgi:catalase